MHQRKDRAPAFNQASPPSENRQNCVKNITPKRDAVTGAESLRLTKLEKTIQTGVQQFIAVGEALMEIRDKRLYRAEFKSFEAYCQKRWKFSRQYAGRLIEAADVAGEIPEKCKLEFTNPQQLKVIGKLPKEDRTEAAEQIVDRAKKAGRKVKKEDIEAVLPPDPNHAPGNPVTEVVLTDADGIQQPVTITGPVAAEIAAQVTARDRHAEQYRDVPPEPEPTPALPINTVQDALAFCCATDEPGHNWEAAATILAAEVERLTEALTKANANIDILTAAAPDTGPLTPASLLAELRKFKPRIPDTLPQPQRAAFGEQIRKMADWLLNPVTPANQ